MNPRAHLARVARALGELNERFVFVGGATVDMFVTDRAAGPARFTEDVDVIVRVGSRVEFHEQIETALRKHGFKPDMREDAPICRWVNRDITLDVMPTHESVLGFSNRWYEDGIVHARAVDVDDGLSIRVLSAPHFIATKLEAFKGRGKSDFLGSADIEDIVRVVDGRPELAAELNGCGEELRAYLRDEIAGLIGADEFVEAIPGHLMGDAASQARADLVLKRLHEISAAGRAE